MRAIIPIFITILIVGKVHAAPFSFIPLPDSGRSKKPDSLIVTLNISNALILRPQITVEKFISPRQSIEVTAGYALPNPEIQKLLSQVSMSDGFLGQGFYGGIGYKKYSFQTDIYYSALLFFKTIDYKNKFWSNYSGGFDLESRIQSGSKRQVGLTFLTSSRMFQIKRFFATIHMGLGVLYYYAKYTYHEQIEPENADFEPSDETISTVVPTFNLGVKMGFGFGGK